MLLEGTNIFLRDVTVSDVDEDYYQWMTDDEVNKYMETRFNHQSIEEIKNYVEKMNSDPNVYFMGIIYKKKEKRIGNIKLGPVSNRHFRSEMSLWIGEKSLWGAGLGTEAISLMRDFACARLKLHKITAGCYSNNIASARAFEKAGFHIEAVLKEEYFNQGKFVDRFCYAYFSRKP